jgi:hypothetical protein
MDTEVMGIIIYTMKNKFCLQKNFRIFVVNLKNVYYDKNKNGTSGISIPFYFLAWG